MRLRTKKFLKKNFKEYYENPEIKIPRKQKNREWGFIHYTDRYPEEIQMKRHRAFPTKEAVKEYLASMAPAHTYYSSAYYEKPDAKKMDQKNWCGADLIFDLDADYIATGDHTYKEMLNQVKKEAETLIKDYLLNDLGFKKKELKLVFSGGRGYHIHIQNKKTHGLGSPERREIIDYISGKGIKPIKQRKQKKEEEIHQTIKLRETKNNWDRKIKKWIYIELPRKIQSKTKKQAIKYLKQLDGVGEKKAKRLYKFYNNTEQIERAKKTNNLNMIRGVKKDIWRQIIEKTIDKHKINADEPVTSDIKRLIRLPGSLHGGTGLQVQPIPINRINKFQPLTDAVVFDEKPIKIKTNENIQIKLKNKETKLKKDKVTEIPRHTAIFLAAKGKIEVEGW